MLLLARKTGAEVVRATVVTTETVVTQDITITDGVWINNGEGVVPSLSQHLALATKVLAHYGLLPGTEAVFLFGSIPNDANDQFSDLDLLVVHERANGSFYYTEGTIEVDLVSGTYTGLLEKCTNLNKDNNNFILNALGSAIILLDVTGRASSLLARVTEILDAGPPEASVPELVQASVALGTMRRSCVKLLRRRLQTQEECVLFRLKCDRLVMKSIYLLFRCEQRWSSSTSITIARLRDCAPEQHERWKAYANARSVDEQWQWAMSISGDVIERIDAITK